MLDHIGIIQIDSVNVLVRSQELPLFARLGPHPRSLIPDATAAGELFEYWVHEACHVRTEDHYLYRWQMDAGRRWSANSDLLRRRPGYVDEVVARIERDGPVCAGDLKARVGQKGSWWDWDDGKIALEHLFMNGTVTAVRRPNDFARVYDLTERVLPAAALARPAATEHQARRAWLSSAAAHLGVATFDDLVDYHRQRKEPCRPVVQELVEDGVLVEVAVEGWSKPAYVHHQATRPRTIDACALLSPFDPVVWNRDRANRLFGFHYRIEIYVPQPKRIYGYYVLPILCGDALVGRLDLKADRQQRTLLVQGAYAEPDVPTADVADRVAAELWAMATWLGLDSVTVNRRGDFERPLRSAVADYARR